jgi:hypothetical protein
MSIWLTTQPPKMSPLALVSLGIAMSCTVGSPRGLASPAGVDFFIELAPSL